MFLETRFLTRGLSKIMLFLSGLLPLALVFAFYPIPMEWVIVYALISMLWIFLVTRGYYSLVRIYFFGFSVILAAGLVDALREKNFIQMIAGMVGVALFLFLYQWMDHRLNRSFNQPGVEWYEGLPSFHPRFKIEVFWNEQWSQAHLRKIDDYGFFVFIEGDERKFARFRFNREAAQTRVPVRLEYKDQIFEGDALIRSVFYERWLGIGLQIQPKDLYHYTQYGKIVQLLRGEGYAN